LKSNETIKNVNVKQKLISPKLVQNSSHVIWIRPENINISPHQISPNILSEHNFATRFLDKLAVPASLLIQKVTERNKLLS